jgi:hypothetical protein
MFFALPRQDVSFYLTDFSFPLYIYIFRLNSTGACVACPDYATPAWERQGQIRNKFLERPVYGRWNRWFSTFIKALFSSSGVKF